MKVNQTTQLVGNKVVLVPYEKKHVLRYHAWMKSLELQELTASEPLSLEEEYAMQNSWRNDENKCTFIVLCREEFEDKRNEIDSMVGDVNLFFNDEEDTTTAEIEIMIAEKSARGKGIGKEAVYIMMRYGGETLNVKRYTAKIGFNNQPSINMFQKIGFTEISRSEVFEEVTLELKVTQQVMDTFIAHTETYLVQTYQQEDTTT